MRGVPAGQRPRHLARPVHSRRAKEDHRLRGNPLLAPNEAKSLRRGGFHADSAPVDAEREPELANFGGEPEFAYVLLRGYKRAISPNLPKNCRFVPTCSEYTALAIKEFGFARGFVLFIWRLMRCNPAGGKGYDSPAWPPVGFKAGDALPTPSGRMPSLEDDGEGVGD